MIGAVAIPATSCRGASNMLAEQARTNDAVQGGANRQYAADPTTADQMFVPFTTREVLRLAPALSASTLRFWQKRRWIAPRQRGRLGVGGDALWSGWQTIAIVIMASVLRSKRDQRTYLGNVGVRTAWDRLSNLSDELLLDDRQDMRLAEEVAAALARMAHDTPELPPDILEGVARVLEALDRKASAARNRVAQRALGVR